MATRDERGWNERDDRPRWRGDRRELFGREQEGEGAEYERAFGGEGRHGRGFEQGRGEYGREEGGARFGGFGRERDEQGEYGRERQEWRGGGETRQYPMYARDLRGYGERGFAQSPYGQFEESGRGRYRGHELEAGGPGREERWGRELGQGGYQGGYQGQGYQRYQPYQSQPQQPYEQRGGFQGGFQAGEREAGQRRMTRGLRNYQRSDERIREDVCDAIMRRWDVDASDVEVKVEKAEVILIGSVQDRQTKRRLEDIAEEVLGVKEVHNQVRVGAREASRSLLGEQSSESRSGEEPSGAKSRTSGTTAGLPRTGP